MGRSAADAILRELMAAGMAADTPVLIVCDVSLPGKKQLTTRLDLLRLATRALADKAPTLILVGEALRQQARAGRHEPIAKPATGKCTNYRKAW
jgi:uroporphyrin-III C-methyltransferase|nr:MULTISPECIES: hypothetical protein [unclassified Sphingopyxis]